MPDNEVSRRGILGDALILRRQELGYAKRKDIADVPGAPAYSVFTDIELGRRSNFGRNVTLALERLYRLPTGAIDRFRDGESEALELAGGRAEERDEQAQFERELDELRHHARTALLLADRISARCQTDRASVRSGTG
jgi:hypothetical protein